MTLLRRFRGPLVGMQVMTTLAALLLAGGLVVRMSTTLSSFSPAARTAVTPDGVLGIATDRGAPLFDGVVLTPGVPVHACARVEVSTPQDPSPITMEVSGIQGSRALAQATRMRVESAPDTASPIDCATFGSGVLVADGTVASLGEDSGPRGAPISTWDPREGGATVWFRVTLLLPEDAAGPVHAQAVRGLGLSWSTSVVAPADAGVADRALLVLGGVAEHSVVPLMVMVVVAVLFLGIQGRIDRHDPKLAAAPVIQGTRRFEEPDVFALAGGGPDPASRVAGAVR